MKPEKWEAILDEVEEWIGEHTFKNHHPPERKDCAAANPHIKPKHIKKAWEELYGR